MIQEHETDIFNLMRLQKRLLRNSDDPFSIFRWYKHIDGYKLISVKANVPESLEMKRMGFAFANDEYVVPNTDNPQNLWVKHYELPFDARHSDRSLRIKLLEDFLGISDQSEALQFANNYGLLTNAMVSLSEYQQDIPGENWNFWKREIEEFKLAYDVWGLLDRNDPKISQYFQRKDIEIRRKDGTIYRKRSILCFERKFRKTPERESPKTRSSIEDIQWYTLLIEDHQPERFQWLVQQPKVYWAAYLLSRLLNESARLGESSLTLWMDLRAQRVQRPPLLLRFTPRTLLSCLWTILAQMFDGGLKLAKCELCHQWMDVTGHRRHKRVHDRCSKRHRQARWRANRVSGDKQSGE